MGKEALKIGANTFQYFTRNPRGGKAKDINEKTWDEETGFYYDLHQYDA